MSGNIAPNLITNGLIIHMDAANTKCYPGSGTTWTNLVGSGTGTLTNGPVYDSANNGSISTDGIDDYITVPVPVITNTFTLNVWVKAILNSQTGSTSYMGVVQRFNGIPTQRNRLLLSAGATFFDFQVLVSGASIDIISDTFTSILNKISMCSVTFDGTSVRIYVNGISVLATPYVLSGPLDSGSATPYLGWGATSADYYMGGKFYNYQVYNVALTSAQLLQNYNAYKGRFGL